MNSFVLDTSLLLGGKEPPPGRWMTTPEARAEVSPGGRDARRLDFWLAQGLEVRSGDRKSVDAVDEAGMAGGNLGRLSDADRSLLALALDQKAILVTDDFTMLDVASRIGVNSQTVNTEGISDTKKFQPRCTGCGRWFDAPQKRDECPVCGSPVVLKPLKA
jgi:UPF0271 protein